MSPSLPAQDPRCVGQAFQPAGSRDFPVAVPFLLEFVPGAAYFCLVHRRLLCVLLLLAALPVWAATGRVLKVLPEYLDLKGRSSLSPSLYERDAYQVYLRENPAKRSGLRFSAQWKLKGDATAPLLVRVELRGVAMGNLPKQLTLEAPVQPKGGWFSHWTNVTLEGEEFKSFGQVTAWRVTLWEGTRLLSHQQSFLWN